eukprot:TRINITY_DN990_c0_g1_i7.p1 TRINITY_DN990_c0_g1~~TRINITY_DN990_c0_g1_i7.p1  ORF type:complete len:1636 (+),score=440.86 TRINITY_DN990_c0_g1_i7:980-5887(+)
MDTEAIPDGWTEESLSKLWDAFKWGKSDEKEEKEGDEELEDWKELAEKSSLFDDALTVASVEKYINDKGKSLFQLTKEWMELEKNRRNWFTISRDITLHVHDVEGTLTGGNLFLKLVMDGGVEFKKSLERVVTEGGDEATHVIGKALQQYIAVYIAHQNAMSKETLLGLIAKLRKEKIRKEFDEFLGSLKTEVEKKMAIWISPPLCKVLVKEAGFDFGERELTYGVVVASQTHLSLMENWSRVIEEVTGRVDEVERLFDGVTDSFSMDDFEYMKRFFKLKTAEGELDLSDSKNSGIMSEGLEAVQDCVLEYTSQFADYASGLVKHAQRKVKGKTNVEKLQSMEGRTFTLVTGQGSEQYYRQGGYKWVEENRGWRMIEKDNVVDVDEYVLKQGRARYMGALQSMYKRKRRICVAFVRMWYAAQLLDEKRAGWLSKKKLAVAIHCIFGQTLKQLEKEEEEEEDDGGAEGFVSTIEMEDEDDWGEFVDSDDEDEDLEDAEDGTEDWMLQAKGFVNNFSKEGGIDMEDAFNLLVRVQAGAEILDLYRYKLKRIVPEFSATKFGQLQINHGFMSHHCSTIIDNFAGINLEELRRKEQRMNDMLRKLEQGVKKTRKELKRLRTGAGALERKAKSLEMEASELEKAGEEEIARQKKEEAENKKKEVEERQKEVTVLESKTAKLESLAKQLNDGEISLEDAEEMLETEQEGKQENQSNDMELEKHDEAENKGKEKVDVDVNTSDEQRNRRDFVMTVNDLMGVMKQLGISPTGGIAGYYRYWLNVAKNVMYLDAIAPDGDRRFFGKQGDNGNWDSGLFRQEAEEAILWAVRHDLNGLNAHHEVWIGGTRITSVNALHTLLQENETMEKEQKKQHTKQRKAIAAWLTQNSSTPYPLHLFLLTDEIPTIVQKHDLANLDGLVVRGDTTTVNARLLRRGTSRDLKKLYFADTKGIDMKTAALGTTKQRGDMLLMKHCKDIVDKQLEEDYHRRVRFRMMIAELMGIKAFNSEDYPWLWDKAKMVFRIVGLDRDLTDEGLEQIQHCLDGGPVLIGQCYGSDRARPLLGEMPVFVNKNVREDWLKWCEDGIGRTEGPGNWMDQMPSMKTDEWKEWEKERQPAVDFIRKCGLAGDDPGFSIELVDVEMEECWDLTWDSDLHQITMSVGTWRKIDYKMTRDFKKLTTEAQFLENETKWREENSIGTIDDERESFEQRWNMRKAQQEKYRDNQNRTDRWKQRQSVRNGKMELEGRGLRNLQNPRKRKLHLHREEVLKEAAQTANVKIDEKKIGAIAKTQKANDRTKKLMDAGFKDDVIADIKRKWKEGVFYMLLASGACRKGYGTGGFVKGAERVCARFIVKELQSSKRCVCGRVSKFHWCSFAPGARRTRRMKRCECGRVIDRDVSAGIIQVFSMIGSLFSVPFFSHSLYTCERNFGVLKSITDYPGHGEEQKLEMKWKAMKSKQAKEEEKAKKKTEAQVGEKRRQVKGKTSGGSKKKRKTTPKGAGEGAGKGAGKEAGKGTAKGGGKLPKTVRTDVAGEVNNARKANAKRIRERTGGKKSKEQRNRGTLPQLSEEMAIVGWTLQQVAKAREAAAEEAEIAAKVIRNRETVSRGGRKREREWEQQGYDELNTDDGSNDGSTHGRQNQRRKTE